MVGCCTDPAGCCNPSSYGYKKHPMQPHHTTCIECDVEVELVGAACSEQCYSVWLLSRMAMADGDPIRLEPEDVLPLPLAQQPWYNHYIGGIE